MTKRMFLGVCLAMIGFYVALGMTVNAAVTNKDVIYLHYDVAPDPDDLHAIVAGKQLMDKAGKVPKVIIGTHGYTSRPGNYPYLTDKAIAMGNLVYGRPNYREVGYDQAAHFTTVAAEWDTVVRNGGKVYVAEGGPSDFTYGALFAMTQDRKKVVVVQHSAWNEGKTNPTSLSYVKNRSTYIKIQDGNFENQTADLKITYNATVANQLIATNEAWRTAFNFFKVNIDFSDTVELLHILDITSIDSPQDFVNYVKGSSPVVSGMTVLATDYTAAYAPQHGWARTTELGKTGMKLLPDTRVTHSDPLIHGTNFWDTPRATMPYLEYQVNAPAAGVYPVSVEILSKGSEDNGAHIYVNGEWVVERLQWCTPKGAWHYSSAIRVAGNPCGNQGDAKVTLKQGLNTIRLGAREDGLFVNSIKFGSGSTVVVKPPLDTADRCAVIADSRTGSISLYNQQCSMLARKDCDPVAGQWICASFNNPQLADVVDEPVVIEPPVSDTQQYEVTLVLTVTAGSRAEAIVKGRELARIATGTAVEK